MNRDEYLAMFARIEDAIAFEDAVLSIPRALLPDCAIAVLDGGQATPEYWQWLTAQFADTIAD